MTMTIVQDSGKRKRRSAKKKLPKPLQLDHAKAIVEICLADTDRYAGRFDHVLMSLLLHGARASEAAHVQVTDVNFNTGNLVIRGGKGGVDRVVPMDKSLSDSMLIHLTKGDGSIRTEGYVLHTPGHITVPISRRSVGRYVKRRAFDAGLPNAKKVHPHRLRHTFGVRFMQKGGDIRVLQKLMGHSDISTTQGYLDYSDKHIDEHARSVGMME